MQVNIKQCKIDSFCGTSIYTDSMGNQPCLSNAVLSYTQRGEKWPTILLPRWQSSNLGSAPCSDTPTQLAQVAVTLTCSSPKLILNTITSSDTSMPSVPTMYEMVCTLHCFTLPYCNFGCDYYHTATIVTSSTEYMYS